MATIFCPSCGFKTTYQFATPNFCSKCGQAYLSKSSLNKSSAILKSKREEPDDEEDEDYDDYDDEDFTSVSRVPRISKIQVELDSSASEVKVFKFGEIFGESAVQNNFPVKRTKDISDFI